MRMRRREAVRGCVCTPESSIMASERASSSSPSRPSLLANLCSHLRRDPPRARVAVSLNMVFKA